MMVRRTSTSLLEASADLGARGWQTFRYITFPMISTSLIGGALLAFALSFDEIVVTTFTAGNFQTLPQWILNNTFRAKNVGEVAAVATLVILISVLMGAELAGILGALAAIPVAGAIQVLILDFLRARRERAIKPDDLHVAAD